MTFSSKNMFYKNILRHQKPSPKPKGISRTDVKLIKMHLDHYASMERDLLKEEARKFEYIRQQNKLKKKAEVAANPTMWHGGLQHLGSRVMAPADNRDRGGDHGSKSLSAKVLSATSGLAKK